jgi:predicted  nucleic acid-binding Zn-ribbon protein
METYLYLAPVLIVGLLAAIGLAWLWWRRHYEAELAALRGRTLDLDRQLAIKQVHASRVPDLEVEVAKLAERYESQNKEKADVQSELAGSIATIESRQAEILDLRDRLKIVGSAHDAATRRIETPKGRRPSLRQIWQS